MNGFILTKKFINNIFIVNIYIKSGNITKYMVFKQTLLMEMIANTPSRNTIISIKIYISKKRSAYNNIISSIVEMLSDFKMIFIIKL